MVFFSISQYWWSRKKSEKRFFYESVLYLVFSAWQSRVILKIMFRFKDCMQRLNFRSNRFGVIWFSVLGEVERKNWSCLSPERSEVEFFNFSVVSRRTLQMDPRWVRKLRRGSIGIYFWEPRALCARLTIILFNWHWIVFWLVSIWVGYD